MGSEEAQFQTLLATQIWRTIELVCWLRVVLMQLMDVALTLGGMQTSRVERLAREQVCDEDAELTSALRNYIVDACAAGLDTTLSHQEARERMLQILDPAQLCLATEAILDHLGIDTSQSRATGPPADVSAA